MVGDGKHQLNIETSTSKTISLINNTRLLIRHHQTTGTVRHGGGPPVAECASHGGGHMVNVICLHQGKPLGISRRLVC